MTKVQIAIGIVKTYRNGDVNALKGALTSFGFQVCSGSDACTLYAQQQRP